jgi:hypothetical protein
MEELIDELSGFGIVPTVYLGDKAYAFAGPAAIAEVVAVAVSVGEPETILSATSRACLMLATQGCGGDAEPWQNLPPKAVGGVQRSLESSLSTAGGFTMCKIIQSLSPRRTAARSSCRQSTTKRQSWNRTDLQRAQTRRSRTKRHRRHRPCMPGSKPRHAACANARAYAGSLPSGIFASSCSWRHRDGLAVPNHADNAATRKLDNLGRGMARFYWRFYFGAASGSRHHLHALERAA